MRQNRIRQIKLGDSEYPGPLKEIYFPPSLFYCKGELLPEDIDAVAIVGSRKCSLYGLQIAEKFGYELAEKGITVVSGMAKGIDSSAHRGALKAGGRTIAVMGSGFDHIYPEGSEELAENIAQNGAVITEYSNEMMPLKQNFPKRNRIISGISKGVIVVEAGKRSGAMITVRFALEQGREVFAVPGRIDTMTSYGTNDLIQTGAKLVTNVDEILEELNMSFARPDRDKKREYETAENYPGENEAETAVLNMLKSGFISHVDNIAAVTKKDPSKLHEVLLRLEIKGKIRVLAGRKYELAKGL